MYRPARCNYKSKDHVINLAPKYVCILESFTLSDLRAKSHLSLFFREFRFTCYTLEHLSHGCSSSLVTTLCPGSFYLFCLPRVVTYGPEISSCIVPSHPSLLHLSCGSRQRHLLVSSQDRHFVKDFSSEVIHL